MAREEADREDLLGEATAFVERIQWKLPLLNGSFREVFVGFRRDGAISFYLDADPVYHFNATNELRRAFADGQLIKAEGGHLVGLERVRSETEVALVRKEFSADQTADFCQQVASRLSEIRIALQQGYATLIGQVPAEGPIEQRVVDWLASHRVVTVANSARAGG
jgi:hypothetical protein